ncbi:molybdopterin-binding protein [Acidiplasma aeolicum]|jgi:molybdenum cofactor synthesis domain-containing protein|uniref:molybdopterin-binding protein n=1 Tax=Acidiplasma aeolicum TaxID=507754 RepID=UPI0037103A60
MNIAVISIGNEVVKGRTVDSNSAEISSFLTSNGFNVAYHIACKDETDEICKSLKFLLDEVDVIITTGGLGPTMDDISIESISKCLRLPLEMNPHAVDILKTKYLSLKLELTEERLKMAKMPLGAEIIENKGGTAPGMFLKYDGKIIFSVPGVPREMRSMLPQILLNMGVSKKAYMSKEIRVNGIMESAIAPLIKEVFDVMNNGINIKSHPESFEFNNPVLIIEFYGYGNSQDDIENRINSTYKEFSQRVKNKFSLSI